MSADEELNAGARDLRESGIKKIVVSRDKDLGGMIVRRVLPALSQRRVGPFIFLDHMGPATFTAETGMDVRPHPHIGLSTLTYLLEGEILHRDSLGFVQPIRPGAVNWMTAGRGIVHSERTPQALRRDGFALHGLQIWIALPDGFEEVEPTFTHHPRETLPIIEGDGVSMTLIAGEALGARSPVKTWSQLFYLHIQAQAGASVMVPDEAEERAVYVVSGEVEVAGQPLTEGQMAVLSNKKHVTVKSLADTCLMLMGGEPLASDRTVWWNFSSSSKARLEQAKADWRNGRFAQIPGETEFIPLPE